MDYQLEDVAWADAVLSLGGVRCIRIFIYNVPLEYPHTQVMGHT